MAALDLKVIVHCGEYVAHEVAGRQQLHGLDVIRAHRLLKNSVWERTGIRAYALFTEAAVDAMGVPDVLAGAPRHVETSAELGDIPVLVADLTRIGSSWADRVLAVAPVAWA